MASVIRNWKGMKRIILKYKQILKQTLAPALNKPTISSNGIIDVKLLGKAGVENIKILQQREFIDELKIIKKAHQKKLNNEGQIIVTRSSLIYGFDPFLDVNGVLRIREVNKKFPFKLKPDASNVAVSKKFNSNKDYCMVSHQ